MRRLSTLVLAAILSVPLSSCAEPGPTEPHTPPPPMEAGGSNYVTYSVGRYLVEPTEEVWYRDGELRPVIGTFDADSAAVHRQLLSMYANGQRRIALVLWYDDFSYDLYLQGRDVHGHIVNSGLGRLPARQEESLRRVLRLVQEVGYQDLIFRFATQNGSRAFYWTSWNESRYQKNWSFIQSVRQVVEEETRGGAMRLLYDLDVELGGIHHLGQGRQYVVRMWRDYTRRFDPSTSIGFSIAYAPGLVAAHLAALDDAGPRPSTLGVDLYSDEYIAIAEISRELRQMRASRMPIIVQEVYYNDQEAGDKIRRAREVYGVNVRYILQWPLARTAHQPHFSMHYPAEFDAYLP
jgi:hypothetical protein